MQTTPERSNRPGATLTSSSFGYWCGVRQRETASARLALVIVLRAELLEQRHRLEERRDALHRAIRHVGRGLPLSADRCHVAALRHQILNELVVAASSGVVNRVVAVEVPRIHVGAELFDEILDGSEPRVG